MGGSIFWRLVWLAWPGIESRRHEVAWSWQHTRANEMLKVRFISHPLAFQREPSHRLL